MCSQPFLLRQSGGFTLIELMITITVLSILLLIGSALTRSWVDRSQINSGISTLKNTVAQAKTAALRNTNNQPLNHPAVSVCWNALSHTLSVLRLAQNSSDLCNVASADHTVLFNSSLAQGIVIRQDQTAFQCLAFNAAGVLIAPAGSSCVNSSSLSLKVEKNNENAEFTLF
ncbi:prepilin-type N-terminal cleavage/methylation domain-containing protein [Acinetobacter sp. 18QD2AZ41W]|uniref:prepilin-type N-terminal cleavage/methylation domain-containing protein n=1 Tax=Acinetobacter sp. 18QD2AZ41W TaxID=2692137 RepID=UPI00135AF6C1|nr:prepilin-type N-terminal cleavage/methylation domain-containing protein [Acinetobacter sp. 18QD2AZ41W]